MYNGHQLLIVYFVLISLIKIVTGRFEPSPYYCDAKEIALIRNPKAFSRFVMRRDEVYLVFKEKIIWFKLNNVRKSQKANFFYNIGQPMVVIVNEAAFDFEDYVLKGYKIEWKQKGFENDKFQTSEVYQHKNGETNRTYLNDLNFNRFPCERGNIITFASTPSISNYSLNFENNDINIVFTYDQRNLDIKLTDLKDKSVSTYDDELDYDVRFAQFYTHPKNLSDNYLIELDSENNLHINQWEFKSSFSVFKAKIPLDRLLSCHQAFDDFSQLKGIYYHEISNSFYIFIYHFYIIIKTDLVKNDFRLNQSELVFFQNAFDPILKEERSLMFDHSDSKWIKSTRDSVYLDLWSSRQYHIYFNEGTSLEFLETNYDLIKECRRQILQIKKLIYCVNEKTYYHVNESLANKRVKPEFNNIKDLFESTPIEYEDYQTVESVFNYKEDTFVLMTQTHLFLVEYSVVDVAKNYSLVFRHDKTKIVRKIKNCILPNDRVNCYKEEESHSTKPGVVINLGSNKILICFLISLFLVIFIICLLVRGRKNVYIFKTRESKGFNESKLNEKLDKASSIEQPSQIEQSPDSMKMFNQHKKEAKHGRSSRFVQSRSTKDKFFVIRMT